MPKKRPTKRVDVGAVFERIFEERKQRNERREKVIDELIEAVVRPELSSKAGQEIVGKARKGHKATDAAMIAKRQKDFEKIANFHMLSPAEKKKIAEQKGFGGKETRKGNVIEGSKIHPDILYRSSSEGLADGFTFLYIVPDNEFISGDIITTHGDIIDDGELSWSAVNGLERHGQAFMGRVAQIPETIGQDDIDWDDLDSEEVEVGTHLSIWSKPPKEILNKILNKIDGKIDFIHLPKHKSFESD